MPRSLAPARQGSNLSIAEEAVNLATDNVSKQLAKDGISVNSDVRSKLADHIKENVTKYMESSKNLTGTEAIHSKHIAKEALELTNVTALKILARKFKQQRREQLLNSVTVPKWWIILPSNRYKLAWDLINVVLIIYSMFEMPFSMAFGTANDCETTWIENLNLFIDCCFCMDSVLNFVTAYADNETGIIVIDTYRIIKRFDPTKSNTTGSARGCGAGRAREHSVRRHHQ
jgi:hypothetical protein